MKIKKETLDLVLNFPLSEIEDFAYDDFEYLKELVKNHSNFVIYNYSFDNIGITNQSEMKLGNDGKQKVIELLTNLFNIHSQYYYDESTDSYLFLPNQEEYNFEDGEEVPICEISLR